MRSIATIALLAGLAACQKSPSGQPPVTAAQAEQIAAAAEATFTSGDTNRIMAQYADMAVMFDAGAPNPSDDRQVQTGWTRNFSTMKPADYSVSQRHIQLIDGDSFISSGIENFTVQAGVARPTVSARFTDVFKRQPDNSWKIIHEHVSSPPPGTVAN